MRHETRNLRVNMYIFEMSSEESYDSFKLCSGDQLKIISWDLGPTISGDTYKGPNNISTYMFFIGKALSLWIEDIAKQRSIAMPVAGAFQGLLVDPTENFTIPAVFSIIKVMCK